MYLVASEAFKFPQSRRHTLAFKATYIVESLFHSTAPRAFLSPLIPLDGVQLGVAHIVCHPFAGLCIRI